MTDAITIGSKSGRDVVRVTMEVITGSAKVTKAVQAASVKSHVSKVLQKYCSR